MPIKKEIEIEEVHKWISKYLAPQGRRAHGIFQFTINGLTYPFVRSFNFAALPDPPKRRRYSMLANLYLTRPGDLLFFFQSDPQWRNDDINSRRGIRGIYRVSSEPFRGIDSVIDPATSYCILGNCPNCGSFHATLRETCPICKSDYPAMQIPSRVNPFHFLLLSLRMEIEPLIVFERALSDERCYADMSDTGMIWIGRHDNQMGLGKGSSVRQLLPEEAVKMTRMLLSEPGQEISFPKKTPYGLQKQHILNPDGTNVTDLELRRIRTKMVSDELMINFDIARSIDQKGSPIVKALGPDFEVDEIEYISSEFPWGYTAGQADFVVSLAGENGRYRIFIMEFKRDKVSDDAFIQVSLYTRWVVQVMSQFANPIISELEVVPIAIGRRLSNNTVRPRPFSFKASYNSGVSVKVIVQSPRFIKYVPADEFTHGNKSYAKKLEYFDESANIPQISWVPEPGVVTSQVERNWVKSTSWSRARAKII